MLEISVETVDSILKGGDSLPEKVPNLSFKQLDAPLTTADSIQIRALEWLTFKDDQTKHLAKFSNILLRRFLIQGKLNAVKTILDRFSVADTDFGQNFHDVESFEMLQQEQMNYSALITAFEMLNNIKNLTSKIPKDEIKFEKWKTELLKQTKDTTNQLLNCVQSPTLGAFISPDTITQEIKLIRGIYIPYLVLEIARINHESSVYDQECLEVCLGLVELVAKNGEFQLYSSFVYAKKLGDFLNAIQKIAVDALGLKAVLPWSSQY